MLYKISDQINFGATYRSHVDVDVDGQARFAGVNPLLTGAIADTGGKTTIRLPAQATAGLAYFPTDRLTLEVGFRWEGWSSTEQLKVDLAQPVLGQSSETVPRNWQATRAYNIGMNYQMTESVSLNAGYLFGESAVPDETFEPMIPDTNAHLFTLGCDYFVDSWTISIAGGYEIHENKNKTNILGDPLGSMLPPFIPVDTANGKYASDIYLLGLSVGYRY